MTTSSATSILYSSRPWSFTASLIPLLHLTLLHPSTPILTTTSITLTVLLTQSCSNYTNTYYDYINGVDKNTNKHGDRGIRDGHVTIRSCKIAAIATGITSILIHFLLVSSPPPSLLPISTLDLFYVLSFLLSVFYTLPPLSLKYRALGDATVATVFGPLLAGYYDMARYRDGIEGWGSCSSDTTTLLPITMLTVGILHGNNLRDIKSDVRSGVNTMAGFMGEEWGRVYYIFLVGGCYVLYVALFLFGLSVHNFSFVLLTLPLAYGNFKKVRDRRYETLDEDTAKLHTAVGVVAAGAIWWG